MNDNKQRIIQEHISKVENMLRFETKGHQGHPNCQCSLCDVRRHMGAARRSFKEAMDPEKRKPYGTRNEAARSLSGVAEHTGAQEESGACNGGLPQAV